MSSNKRLTSIHYAWLIPAIALGITIWFELFFGNSILKDFVVIASCLLIASYWISIAKNWGGLRDSLVTLKQMNTKNDFDVNQFYKKLRIVSVIISASMLMIAIPRTIILILGRPNG